MSTLTELPKVANRIQLFQLRLFSNKAEKSNTTAKSLMGVTIKNTQTEQNLVSRDTYPVAIYIHKKARSNFKLSGKDMDGNVSGIKLVFPDKPFALIFDLLPFRRDNLH